jgi:hypothetical protein
VILDGEKVSDPTVQRNRESAFKLAHAEREWKKHIIHLSQSPDSASSIGLPSFDAVLRNADVGSATMVSMLGAWKAAKALGAISDRRFSETCAAQVRLLKTEIRRAQHPEVANDLRDMLSEYEFDARSASGVLSGFQSSFSAPSAGSSPTKTRFA